MYCNSRYIELCICSPEESLAFIKDSYLLLIFSSERNTEELWSKVWLHSVQQSSVQFISPQKKPNPQKWNFKTCLILEICYSFPYRDKRIKWTLFPTLNSWNCFQPEEIAWNIRYFRMLHTESCKISRTEVRQTSKRRALPVLHKVLIRSLVQIAILRIKS